MIDAQPTINFPGLWRKRGGALLFALLIGLFSTSLVFSSPPPSSPSIEIEAWTPTTPLPEPLANENAVLHDDHLYFVAGKDTADAPTTNIYAAPIQVDGTLGAWTNAGQLPVALYLHAVAATATDLFVIGGWDGERTRAEVWRAPFLGPGLIGGFTQASILPVRLDLHEVVIVQNRIYVIGGWTGREPLNTVYYAEIQPGSLGAWTPSTPLPQPIFRLSATAVNNRIYVTGGFNNLNPLNTVYVANVRPDGALEAWRETTALPTPIHFHQTVVHDGRLLVIGGANALNEFATVYAAPLLADGALGGWAPLPALPESLHRFAALTVTRNGSDFIYVLGGLHGVEYRAAVYYSTYPPPATPTPTATATATLTPTPPPEALVDVQLQNQPQRWLAPGEEVTYTISYHNRSAQTLTGVEIVNVVPLHVELAPESIQGVVTAGNYTYTGTGPGASIMWSVGEVPPDGAGQVRYRARRPLPAPPTVPRILAITVIGPTAAEPGAPITYSLALTNNTALPMAGLTLTARIPLGATYRSGGEQPPQDGQLVWTIPTLAGEEQVTRQFVVSAEQSLVLYDYAVISDEGLSVQGQTVLMTQINQTDPQPPGDGTFITNAGAMLRWQTDEQPFARTSNPVYNPVYDLHLPLITR